MIIKIRRLIGFSEKNRGEIRFGDRDMRHWGSYQLSSIDPQLKQESQGGQQNADSQILSYINFLFVLATTSDLKDFNFGSLFFST